MPAVVVGDLDTGLNYAAQQQVWINQGEIPKGLQIYDVDKDGVITFKDLNDKMNRGLVSDTNGNIDASGNLIIDAVDLLKDPRWANGKDDDGNGYIDDLVGWNFVAGTNNATDWHGHGTWVSNAIIGAGGGRRLMSCRSSSSDRARQPTRPNASTISPRSPRPRRRAAGRNASLQPIIPTWAAAR